MCLFPMDGWEYSDSSESHICEPYTYIHTQFIWPSRRLINSNRKISSAFGLFHRQGVPEKKETFVCMDKKFTKVSFLEWKSVLSHKANPLWVFLNSTALINSTITSSWISPLNANAYFEKINRKRMILQTHDVGDKDRCSWRKWNTLPKAPWLLM